VSEQPVPAHADAKTSTHPVKDERGNHRRPAPEPESRDGSKMRDNKKNGCAPINPTSCRTFGVVFKYHSTKLPWTSCSRNLSLNLLYAISALTVYLNTEEE
jgi:hypothetical protein